MITRYGPHGKYVEVWGVESSSRKGQVYTVARTAEGVYSCSCPRWIFNTPRPECKHIRELKAWRRSSQTAPLIVEVVPEKVLKALNRFSLIEV